MSATSWNVALVQMDASLGDVEKNVAKVAGFIEARDRSVDLMVFPELTLTGYGVGDGYARAALRVDDPTFTALVKATAGVRVALGFIEETPEFRFYNSMAILDDGRIAAIHRKIALPNYGIFEEGKIFSRGTSHENVDCGAFRLAPFICADAWNPGLVHLAALDGASVLVFSVASPAGGLGAKLDSKEGWKRLCRLYATTYGCYVVFVNRVGREGDVVFWGESELIDPFGKTVTSIPDAREAVANGTIDRMRVREARIIMPGTRDEDVHVLRRGLDRVLRNQQNQQNQQNQEGT